MIMSLKATSPERAIPRARQLKGGWLEWHRCWLSWDCHLNIPLASAIIECHLVGGHHRLATSSMLGVTDHIPKLESLLFNINEQSELLPLNL